MAYFVISRRCLDEAECRGTSFGATGCELLMSDNPTQNLTEATDTIMVWRKGTKFNERFKG